MDQKTERLIKVDAASCQTLMGNEPILATAGVIPGSAHDEDKAFALVEHFASRLVLVFSYFFFTVEFKKDSKLLAEPGMSWRGLFVLPTIHDACFNTTLMAIRDLDDFFTLRTTRDARKDDLKASDLGLEVDLGFLVKSERERINKLIMHSTTVAVSGNQNTPWDFRELLSKCIPQGLYFLKWVAANYTGEKHQKVGAAAAFWIVQLNLILENAKKLDASRSG